MRILIAITLALTLTACETVSTTQPGTVGVSRQQSMLVSEKEVRKACWIAMRNTYSAYAP
jgi:hypothetical protein